MTDKKKLFIVEDHPMFRERVAQVINAESDMRLAGEAESAETALPLIREIEPDLILMDITLPGDSGLTLIESLKEHKVAAPILVLSMHPEAGYADRAIRAGASGYITKNSAAADVLSAIRHVLSGEVYLSEKATSDLARKFRNPRTTGAARLTDRELEVLRLLGEGRTTREIAQTLSLGIASIDTYRARIKEKMNLRNGVELQRFATLWRQENE